MKKTFISLICLVLIALASHGALYEEEITPTEPTYTLAQLNTMVGWLESYYGDCMAIFYLEGGDMDLCTEAYKFTKVMESNSISILANNPTYTDAQWSNACYAAYNNWFSNSRFAAMFASLTQPQLNQLLYKVMYWNPLPYNASRTFAEFKTWVLSQ